jgi:hypothetical protein
MAFKVAGLENHSSSGAGARRFSYKTTDSKATVKGAGYFNAAALSFRVGDELLIAASDATFHAKVSAIAAGVVTIAALDTFA